MSWSRKRRIRQRRKEDEEGLREGEGGGDVICQIRRRSLVHSTRPKAPALASSIAEPGSRAGSKPGWHCRRRAWSAGRFRHRAYRSLCTRRRLVLELAGGQHRLDQSSGGQLQ